ncbi:MAG: hypothetical protein ACOVP7_09100 [Lacibacter sp.]
MRITKVRTHRYSSADIEKLDIALELLSNAINSVEFQHNIEEHELFDTSDGYSNKDIYNIIMSGDEADTGGGIDHEADLNLTLDLRTSTDAIGYTKHERIFTFQNFFEQLEPTKLAGHYAHEYCHTLGFADPSDLSDLSRNVPYEVGRIIEEISISNRRTFIMDESELTDSEKTLTHVRKTARRSGIVHTDSTTAARKTSRAKTKGKKAAAKKKAVVKKKVVVKKSALQSAGTKKKTTKRKTGRS